jgi:hypothetical protein
VKGEVQANRIPEDRFVEVLVEEAKKLAAEPDAQAAEV